MDIETALASATMDQLWKELTSRCQDALFLYDMLDEKGINPDTYLASKGTVAQILGLIKFADLHIKHLLCTNNAGNI